MPISLIILLAILLVCILTFVRLYHYFDTYPVFPIIVFLIGLTSFILGTLGIVVVLSKETEFENWRKDRIVLSHAIKSLNKNIDSLSYKEIEVIFSCVIDNNEMLIYEQEKLRHNIYKDYSDKRYLDYEPMPIMNKHLKLKDFERIEKEK